jgi:hypothetical protein
VRLPRRLVAALVVAAASLVAPAPAGAQVPGDLPPGLGIRQLDVDPAGDEAGRSARSVTEHVEPGGVLERRIQVSNATQEARTVRLYAADAGVEEGWTVVGGRGTGELASWAEVDPPELTIAAGGGTTARLRIVVPPDAATAERYAAIVAEALPVADTIVPRAELRVYLSVGPEEPPTDFLIDELTPGRDDDGTSVVLLGLDNTGGRAVDVVGELELTDGPGGARAGPFPVEVPTTLAPERFVTVTVVLDPGLADGPWRAVVTLRSGAVERQVEASIVFPEAGVWEAVVATPTSDRGLLVPAAAGLLLLSMCVVLLAWWQHRPPEARAAGTVAAASPPTPTSPAGTAGTGRDARRPR